MTPPADPPQIDADKAFEPEVLAFQVDESLSAARREGIGLGDAIYPGGGEAVGQRRDRAHHLHTRRRASHRRPHAWRQFPLLLFAERSLAAVALTREILATQVSEWW